MQDVQRQQTKIIKKKSPACAGELAGKRKVLVRKAQAACFSLIR